MIPHALPRLAQRLFNRPLAIQPDKAEMIVAALADRLGIAHMFRDGVRRPAAWSDDDDDASPWLRSGRVADPGYDIVNGVALIEICGTLVQKADGVRPQSGMTGYNGIREAVMRALMDPGAAAIAFDIDSPGGEVAGCFDLVDTIFAARGVKPIWAILSENACSAAYAIASAADVITIPRTGCIGSIGVVTMHVDLSRALDANGVAVTFITYGDRKADGNEYEPLADAVRAAIQADIDAMGDLFVATVARDRGLTPDAVRAQQAAVYLGAAGVAAGLADAVMAPDAAFRALIDKISELK